MNSDHVEVDWAAYRAEFPSVERTTFLNTCSLGALSRRSRAAVNQFLDLWELHGASAWYRTWLGECAALRASFERLVGAPSGSVALAPSVGVALGVIASSYDYRARPKIITTALDFPTIPYQWLARPECEVVILPSDDGISVPLERYQAALDERVALVATSHVFFTSGYIQPIAEIARLAHQVGAHALIDGYQGAGQVAVDVVAHDLDFYMSGGLKWLLGGPGIVEFYARPALIDTLQPTLAGWFGHREQFQFDPEHFAFHEDARKFEVGTPALAAVYAARAGLDLLLEIGQAQVQARTAELVADLVARLRERGAELKLPSNLREHAGIVMLRADDPAAVVRHLREHTILVDHRPGYVRVSPYFYNTVEDNAAFVAALE
ncbi:MAG: aminotransferase class V-fold PLP-dependent enzyme [Roseiflexaceae bacterium]|nr:aminotransferase class V-fold PLP-dependent enzyme [Roseiflexaceae bacterium]